MSWWGPVSVARAGDAGALIELGDISFEELQAALSSARRFPGVEAAIAGHSSILVLHSGPMDGRALTAHIARGLQAGSDPVVSAGTHELRVGVNEQDAPDLPRLLLEAGIDREEFLAELASLRLCARYLGFRPGFAYLDGLPARWQLPRLSTPRTAVPAGSLGISGSMAGFYPETSPGGWNLIGRTDAVLWDPWSERPNLIAPGDWVRIRPTEQRLVRPENGAGPGHSDPSSDLAEVVLRGQLTLLVRPGGRTRCAAGLSEGGAFDAQAAAAANAAVGNGSDAPLLECVAIGPTIRFLTDCVISWAGAMVELKINGRAVRASQQVAVGRGEVLSTGPLHDGFRGYLAVSPEPIDDGGPFQARPTTITDGLRLQGRKGPAQSPRIRTLARSSRLLIRALAGPHPVDEERLRQIEGTSWTVSSHLDRVGIRLQAGEGIEVDVPANLPSCGMQFGTVQWHPDGNLVVLGPDHPITGGYLQVFTVLREELWKLAHLRPGETLRWVIQK